MHIKSFISIDWGTSNFRMRLVNADTLQVIETINSSKGVKDIYNEWSKNKGDREHFFLNFLKDQYLQFKTPINDSVSILISGMASSSIGIRELPYANLPFSSSGKELHIEKANTSILTNPIYLISGVRTKSDVIRGEEVQILGLLTEEDKNKSSIFILPGTHSKHISFKKDSICDFRTFMTGELFDVISKHTILKTSIGFEKSGKLEHQAFKAGVLQSNKNDSTILNNLFKIRTHDLFGKKTLHENYCYLSGLLIGEELKTLKSAELDSIKLCAGGNLFELYHEAINILGLESKTIVLPKEIVESSVIKGQLQLLNQLEE